MEEQMKDEKIKQTKKELFWEVFRFLLVGGLATVADYLVATLFYAVLLSPQRIGQTWALIISTALGFGVGLVINWFLSLIFVFKAIRDKKQASSKKSFLIYLIICVIGLAISILGMQLVKIIPAFPLFGVAEFLGSPWKWWLMKAVMTLIVLVWNYIGRKLFVFKS
ncbi:MAG: GtrA family protein [Clostridia bacterium]|nr:GtrA family protein [Clostridia bacterium]MBQ7913673.1 GtrA family protein [Clostridia bacterium]